MPPLEFVQYKIFIRRNFKKFNKNISMNNTYLIFLIISVYIRNLNITTIYMTVLLKSNSKKNFKQNYFIFLSKSHQQALN